MCAIMTEAVVLDIEQIRKLLPHRAPFLFVERLADIVKLESATGYKAVSANEPHFLGHFPEYAVMPGVLLVEAMAQTAGALVVYSLGFQRESRIVYFMDHREGPVPQARAPGRHAAHAGEGAAAAGPGLALRRPCLCRRRPLRRSRIQRDDSRRHGQ